MRALRSSMAMGYDPPGFPVGRPRIQTLVTFTGARISIWGGWHLARGEFLTAFWIMLGANIFDFIDGKVAAETGKMSKFGGFWDSVIDRFSDLALWVGLICLYSSLGRTDY